MADSQRTSKPINFVHQDEIWKANVEFEKDCAKVWSKKWGFLTKAHEEYERETVKLKERLCVMSPRYLAIQPLTPPEKHINIRPSPSVPLTTQGFIGWRSRHSHLQLEKPDIMHHRRCSFLKKLD